MPTLLDSRICHQFSAFTHCVAVDAACPCCSWPRPPFQQDLRFPAPELLPDSQEQLLSVKQAQPGCRGGSTLLIHLRDKVTLGRNGMVIGKNSNSQQEGLTAQIVKSPPPDLHTKFTS